ncbi:hypothetical protein [Nocardioides ungokensis]|uniref:hypothetical protein n=1 Tax=Nocardioides ungokensis TaxID=1643322 RepID=UPI0015DD702C|nr:hypothetical protein [Nocardioides ungokensis]
MDLRSRTAIAVLPALLCFACADVSGDQNARAAAALPSTQATGPGFATPSPYVRHLTARFVRAACEYDAATDGARDFLASIDRLVTPHELSRLADSPRAHLPWRVLRARQERTDVAVDGISQGASAAPRVRVLVWITVTTNSSFAKVREHEHVTLSLIHDHSGWKVERARGAGL